MQESVRSRLEADLKTAMRARDTASRDAIRYILAAIKNAEIEQRRELHLNEEEAVLRRLGKQHADAIEQYRAGGREDLAAREETQLAVVERYLPASMSDDELSVLVDAAIQDVHATGPKDMGKVMKVLIDRTGNRADGRQLSAAARSALANKG